MKPNNNHSSLPIYESSSQRHSQRGFFHGEVYSLLASKSKFLPFQFVVPTTTTAITSATIHRPDGSSEDVFSLLNAAGLTTVATTNFNVIVFPGSITLSSNLSIGRGYLSLSDGTNTWYSEDFVIADEVSKCLKVEFWHGSAITYDAGQIDYSTTYKQTIYLDGAVITPDYKVEKTITKIQSYEFLEVFETSKVYKFTVPLPEYMVDLMRLIPAHNNILITDQYHEYTAIHPYFEMGDWLAGGQYAPVTIKFEIDKMIRAKGTLGEFTGKDFNIDFNEDFNI